MRYGWRNGWVVLCSECGVMLPGEAPESTTSLGVVCDPCWAKLSAKNPPKRYAREGGQP